ncbi:hypothetical protein FKP32DRAFT_1678220 [Trametes sanguinea]|nr:hypothetical protein FKP32DRAFT_1678220 [Trametes sanguinea]
MSCNHSSTPSPTRPMSTDGIPKTAGAGPLTYAQVVASPPGTPYRARRLSLEPPSALGRAGHATNVAPEQLTDMNASLDDYVVSPDTTMDIPLHVEFPSAPAASLDPSICPRVLVPSTPSVSATVHAPATPATAGHVAAADLNPPQPASERRHKKRRRTRSSPAVSTPSPSPRPPPLRSVPRIPPPATLPREVHRRGIFAVEQPQPLALHPSHWASAASVPFNTDFYGNAPNVPPAFTPRGTSTPHQLLYP